ncbi:MAG: hypothetical protein FWD68_15740 [Alphaproteobacteria bacterium]|nr:hypothetical protein [Alphaproteobacteria bacterium]
MISVRDIDDDEACPVRDELLGEMYRASESGLQSLVESVSSGVRARLALFCYHRSHLHSLGVAIAASCSPRELIDAGGRVGSMLYAQSRDVAMGTAAPPGGRKPITLSTKPLTAIEPMDDEVDEFDDEPDALSVEPMLDRAVA